MRNGGIDSPSKSHSKRTQIRNSRSPAEREIKRTRKRVAPPYRKKKDINPKLISKTIKTLRSPSLLPLLLLAIEEKREPSMKERYRWAGRGGSRTSVLIFDQSEPLVNTDARTWMRKTHTQKTKQTKKLESGPNRLSSTGGAEVDGKVTAPGRTSTQRDNNCVSSLRQTCVSSSPIEPSTHARRPRFGGRRSGTLAFFPLPSIQTKRRRKRKFNGRVARAGRRGKLPPLTFAFFA